MHSKQVLTDRTIVKVLLRHRPRPTPDGTGDINGGAPVSDDAGNENQGKALEKPETVTGALHKAAPFPASFQLNSLALMLWFDREL